MNPPAGESLLSLLPPTGTHREWWPAGEMQAISPHPTSWVTIAQRSTGVDASFRSCALLHPDHVAEELTRDRSLTAEVGEVELFGDTFHDGMTDNSVRHLEFFCQIRADDLEAPSVDWSPPFLWYWRAFRRDDVWIYRDAAGRDHELARFETTTEGAQQVKVEAMALRHYLHRRDRNLLVSFDLNSNHHEPAVEREEHQTASAWTSAGLVIFNWDDLDDESRAAVWLHGQYVVLPAPKASGPDWYSNNDDEPGAGLEFIYGVDPETGVPVTVTPTLANTGTDGAPGPHAFARIFFRPQVLERYTSEPRRYRVSSSRIECLHHWGLSIGRTSDGLVEVDLFDLRTKARSELLHWQPYNVAPSGGTPDLGKFRRERLNKAAGSPDPVRELRAALGRVNSAAVNRFGGALWRDQVGDSLVEWEALHPPTGDDRNALQQPLLATAKALCDQIDQRVINTNLTAPPPANAGSLVRLRQLTEQVGGNPDMLSPLFQLWEARSKGFAHSAGRSGAAAVAALAPGLTKPADIFTELTRRLVTTLDHLADVFDPDRRSVAAPR